MPTSTTAGPRRGGPEEARVAARAGTRAARVEAASAVEPARTRARAALVRRLQSSDAPIVAVVAPAGYGKTTLLGQWMEAGQPRQAWVSLDARDNDPGTLLSYLATALDRLEPMEPAVLRSLTAPGSVDLAAGGHRLGGRRIVDADAVHDGPRSRRGDPEPELPRHHCRAGARAARGRVARARLTHRPADPDAPAEGPGPGGRGDDDDLAMDEHEARQLLDTARLRARRRRSASSCSAPRGGRWGCTWPRWRLVRAAQRPRSPGSTCTGATAWWRTTSARRGDVLAASPDRPVPRALLGARQPQRPALRRGDGSDGFTVGSRGARGVEPARRAPRPPAAVVPVPPPPARPPEGRAGAIRARADPRRHHRAAAWFEANERPALALEHAQAAGDDDRAARLFVQVALPTYGAGRVDTVMRWLGWFEVRGLMEEHPQLAVLGALGEAVLGHVGTTERWAGAALAAAAAPTASCRTAARCRDGWA